jgi:hypothetical protein
MVELIWDGKYKDGKRTAPPKLKLPFQTVETVNESAQQRQLSFEALLSGQPTDWRNRLIWGDKKYVLPALLDEFAGQVDLIYIDPPFAPARIFRIRLRLRMSVLPKRPALLSKKLTAIPGAGGWTHTFNGFTKRYWCFTNYLMRKVVFTYIWITT